MCSFHPPKVGRILAHLRHVISSREQTRGDVSCWSWLLVMNEYRFGSFAFLDTTSMTAAASTAEVICPAYWPSRPEAAILVILENTSGTGWLLLTIAHARNDVPLR